MMMAAVGLAGCSALHRDRNAGYSSESSGTSATPTMEGPDRDATPTRPTQPKPLQEQEQQR